MDDLIMCEVQDYTCRRVLRCTCQWPTSYVFNCKEHIPVFIFLSWQRACKFNREYVKHTRHRKMQRGAIRRYWFRKLAASSATHEIAYIRIYGGPPGTV